MTNTRLIGLVGAAVSLAVAAAAPLATQTPSNQPEILACYDSRTSSTGRPQGTGIVYRIGVSGVVAQQGCVDPRHTPFSWTTRHRALTGLADDDHAQYLLANGARVVTHGFAVTGGYPTPASVPASGAGTRFMWVAGRAALRAGHIDESHAALWDDGAIGVASTALGFNSNASGAFAFACCAEAIASNQFATVLGSGSTASGWAAAAIGNNATASGDYSTAIGFQANTNGMHGSTVIADAQGGPPVRATSPNSFVARALRVWFGPSGDQPTSPAGYFTVHGLIASTTGGFKFPDGTVQTTAAVGGGAGATDHGALTGLTDDDHPHYLLTDGRRSATDGFAVTGTLNTGDLPVTGAGVRLLWYPARASLRAGGVDGTHWDNANVGFHSTALGRNTIASADYATALGNGATANGTTALAVGSVTVASGPFSVAMGVNSTATGNTAVAIGNDVHASALSATAIGNNITAGGAYATAMGLNVTATGVNSLALGSFTTASGDRSTAMGRNASTNLMEGSFVYGDASTVSALVTAEAPNQFTARASGGFRFRTSSDLVTGCDLPAGSGTFVCTSDSNRKENFRDEDGEAVLGKIAHMPIRSWNYKTRSPAVRHLGPTAQDFYAAFGLGENATTISTVDAAGVALLAIQALERRTREQASEIEALRAELVAIRAKMAQGRP
ncbi:MAG TPA: tail fiber domain-containing protein [Gemmatimonadales bacterium]